MPRHYIGERTVHDVGNFKEFCGSKDSRERTADHLDLDTAVGLRRRQKL
jgi:hypothetical protein